MGIATAKYFVAIICLKVKTSVAANFATVNHATEPAHERHRAVERCRHGGGDGRRARGSAAGFRVRALDRHPHHRRRRSVLRDKGRRARRPRFRGGGARGRRRTGGGGAPPPRAAPPPSRPPPRSPPGPRPPPT